MAGLIYKELWHDPKTCEWAKRWSSNIGWLWVKLLSFVDDHESNGFLTELQATTVAALNHIPQAAVAELIEAHGLDVMKDGRYRIHNYVDRDRLSRIRSHAGRTGMRRRWGDKKPDNKSDNKTPLTKAITKPLQTSGDGDGVVRIFETWRGLLGRSVSLTPGRRRVIEARLRDGYSESDLCDAATGWRNDPWPDRPLHNDLTVLFRNGEQVEKFRDLQRHGKPSTTLTTRAAQGVRAGRDWADLAKEFKVAGL